MFEKWTNREFDTSLLVGGLLASFMLFLSFVCTMILRRLELPQVVLEVLNLFENLLLMTYTFHFTRTLPFRKGTKMGGGKNR